MKKIFTVLLTIFTLIGLKAQSSSELKTRFFELHLGVGKIGLLGHNYIAYSLKDSPTYETNYIIGKGIEISSRFTMNWNLNKRHEAILGLGFNVWSHNSSVTGGDVFSNWHESSAGVSKFLGQLDLILGYRYFLMKNKNYGLFLENGFYGKMISIGKYPGVKFSIEPGIGMKFKVNGNINLLTVINFKQPISHSSFSMIYKNSLGIRLGINKSF